MGNDFTRVAEVSPRDLGARTRILRLLHIDLWLVLPLLALSAGGLFVLFSASGQSENMLIAQIRNLAVAMFILLVTAQVRVDTLKGAAPYLFVLAILLLVAVALFGVGAKGAQRWLNLGFIRFQPSEVMKFTMPLAIAWWFSKKALPPNPRALVYAFAMVALPSLLILRQPDLGTSSLVASGGRHIQGRGGQ